MATIRVYHFLSAENALDDIQKRRIKISEVDQLNDPFELLCVSQEDKRLRVTLRDYKKTMHQRFGLLCFCRGWSNPVLWAHYGDKHRGMCLGFDVQDNTVRAVTYVSDRPIVPYPISGDLQTVSDQLLWTKYSDWAYEEELRSWIRFMDRDPATRFYFSNFNETIQLKEVIAGPLCTVSEAQIRQALGDIEASVAVIKARLAFRTFRVVTQGWKFDTEYE
jgi:hypothetical protein